MQDVQQIRNTVILGHGNSGKSTLAEALLFTAGSVKRLGKVDEGTASMDFEPEEIKRRISISTAFNHLTWKKNDVYLIDTPGDDNFFNETRLAAQVADSAVLTVGAVLGVRPQTEKFVDLIKEHNLPCLICITKMDRERANFAKTVDGIRETTGLNPVVLYLPIGAEDHFKGVVDIVANKALLFTEGGKATNGEIPADMVDEVEALRESLLEYVAETDDELLERFLEEGLLSDEELQTGLAAAIRTSQIAPVCALDALGNAGSSIVLDAVINLLPSPDQRPARVGSHPKTGDQVERRGTADSPFSALVFKTMADPFAGRLTIFRIVSGTLKGDTFYNATKGTSERFGQLFIMAGKEQRPVEQALPGMVVAVAKLKETTTGDTLCEEANPIVYPVVEPLPTVIAYSVSAKKGDEEKLFSSITRLLDEDLTLRLTREQQTHETLISGVGQVHLEVIGEKIKRKFGVEMELHPPRVPYRETLKGKVTVQGRHKKQSGGRGQFGDCTIEMEPLPRGEHFEFVDKIVGGVIPQQYRPAVEKGILEAMDRGVIAGFPFVDLKVNLVDGSYHTVDSSEMAFKVAGSLAFKKGVVQANPVLLEPIMEVEVRVHKDFVGDVMGDLNSRRGRVLGMDSTGKLEIINAHVPQAEILLYALDLTSMTGGRGTFTVKFSHYEEVPAQIAEKIIAEYKQQAEE
ncbi:elongation factor G [Desulfobulbus alkaliphilus]|uniref:elongation factor G n=1 Tax=Desulfobulbus alkaliphilus TaxID=869814 RepID=UPI001963451D|nr:elongation factor G [Desulfobulbus alkaliphilus]MBM9537949.1 elongation factor G [Desulfobulbus alkaliphilus]